MKKLLPILICAILFTPKSFSQRIPSESENLDFLVTFGNQAKKSYGDDDFKQIFFISVPKSYSKPFYIRVFDPEAGGKHDADHGGFNSKFKYSVYGGNGAFSEPDAHKVNPSGKYKSGVLLATKTFGSDLKYDDKWYTFGPFNPMEGELDQSKKERMFKVIMEGLSGDDGNLYRYFISESSGKNVTVEGANAFTYEYSFRLKSTKNSVAHLYPYISHDVVSITQHNFDFDNDGQLLIYSIAKNRHISKGSGDNNWATGKHQISKSEKGSTIDIQVVKGKTFNNDMVIYITNQYNKPVPFYAIPIGGKPEYDYNLRVTK